MATRLDTEPVMAGQPDAEEDDNAAWADAFREVLATTLDTVDTESDAQEDAEDERPGTDELTDRRARKAASRGRSLEVIKTAYAYLVATGQDVNGTTYAAHVGVSARTGRRDLVKIGITAA
jgi:hypothetical protein